MRLTWLGVVQFQVQVDGYPKSLCKRKQLNVWPVALRELREAARRPSSRRLRLGSAAVGIILLWLILANSDGPAFQTGSLLMGSFHSLLLGLIFLIVPALSADSISREKRDGTLGLLFLTPLSADGIVAGKLLAQGLRAMTLWLAVLPLITIPFLTGGATWFDALSALAFELCAAVLCLGAGLLASSFARERGTAFFLAFLLAAVFLLVFAQSFQLLLTVMWRGPGVLKDPHAWQLQQESLKIFTGLGFQTGALWSSIGTFSALLAKIWKWLCWCSPAIASLILFVLSRIAAARIQRSWQDKIPSRLRESLFNPHGRPITEKSEPADIARLGPPSLVAPLFRRKFRRRMQRTLDWNPIVWLQQYSWKARLSKWCLCLLFLTIAFLGATGSGSEDGRELTLTILLLTLAGFYTFVGVSGFLEEKRSGALELLLVTPVSARKLIFGRTWGLWNQFLPAGAVLGGLYSVSEWQRSSSVGDWSAIIPFSVASVFGGFLTLPIFATYFALRVKNLILATILTWIALGTPVLFAVVATDPFSFAYRPNHDNLLLMPLMVFVWNALFAILTCFLLRHSLSRRLYPF